MFRLLGMAMMATPGWDMMSSWDKVSAKVIVDNEHFVSRLSPMPCATHLSNWSSQ
ncbi:hypothetical protein [Hoylesella buccalis]|jgi:hypothetical protein|uniref:hypothetical protein n=1 Tax=Hoylesella buccalis TaxID=28127 RepID=UPI000311AFFD|nr:hypothetical protein [Hoylesella buccalis]